MEVMNIQKKLRENFKKVYDPTQNVAVDEGIIPFKGRFKYRQHVKGKPHSTGIKFFAIADDKAYLYDFWIYAGGQDESLKPQEIVERLANKLPQKNARYCIFADCFYGSEKLAEALMKKKKDFVLSCQANRPSFLFSDNLQKGLKKKEWKSVYHQENKLIATSFFDTDLIFFFFFFFK